MDSQSRPSVLRFHSSKTRQPQQIPHQSMPESAPMPEMLRAELEKNGRVEQRFSIYGEVFEFITVLWRAGAVINSFRNTTDDDIIISRSKSCSSGEAQFFFSNKRGTPREELSQVLRSLLSPTQAEQPIVGNFSLKKNMEGHRLFHTGKKPLKCCLCDREFARRSSMIRHFATHSPEKRFQCDICERKFSWKADVARHVKVHTREEQEDAFERSRMELAGNVIEVNSDTKHWKKRTLLRYC